MGGEPKTPARESGEQCGSAGLLEPVAISFSRNSPIAGTFVPEQLIGVGFRYCIVLWYELLMVCSDPTLTSEYKIDSKLSLLIHSRVYGM